jgi:NAD(P)-dependent dehydrogenase (short-subunit alcohol dehydrogenase family)
LAELKDKHVVVLGGSSGIGYATATACVAAGARVTIASRDAARVAAAARTLDASGRSASVDATSRGALDAFFAGLERVDHLVLSLTSGGGAGLFRELDLDALRAAIDGKLWAYVNALQAALPYLAKDGGASSVTMVTAGSARMAAPATSGLAASNGALNAMVGPLALELAPVRVNAVCPGVVTTPTFERWPEDLARRVMESAQATPVGRAGRPEEVASVVLMLMQNAYLTGSIIDCDGGIRLRS